MYNQLQYHQETGLLYTDKERETGLFLHLSALANLIVPFAGYILPIVIWQSNKDQMPGIVAHGKEAVNWMISVFIYNLIAVIGIIIGIVFLIAEIPAIGVLFLVVSGLAILTFSILNIVYAVVGGLKASKGEHWHYPLNIKFLK